MGLFILLWLAVTAFIASSEVQAKPEDSCINLTPEKEKVIDDIIDKITTFLRDLQKDMDHIDIILLKIDFDEHSGKEKEDKDLKLQITVNDCDGNNGSVSKSSVNHKDYGKSVDETTEIATKEVVTEKTEENNGSAGETNAVTVSESTQKSETDPSVDNTPTETVTKDYNITEKLDSNKPKDKSKSRRRHKRRRHHKKKHSKQVTNDEVTAKSIDLEQGFVSTDTNNSNNNNKTIEKVEHSIEGTPRHDGNITDKNSTITEPNTNVTNEETSIISQSDTTNPQKQKKRQKRKHRHHRKASEKNSSINNMAEYHVTNKSSLDNNDNSTKYETVNEGDHIAKSKPHKHHKRKHHNYETISDKAADAPIIIESQTPGYAQAKEVAVEYDENNVDFVTDDNQKVVFVELSDDLDESDTIFVLDEEESIPFDDSDLDINDTNNFKVIDLYSDNIRSADRNVHPNKLHHKKSHHAYAADSKQNPQKSADFQISHIESETVATDIYKSIKPRRKSHHKKKYENFPETIEIPQQSDLDVVLENGDDIFIDNVDRVVIGNVDDIEIDNSKYHHHPEYYVHRNYDHDNYNEVTTERSYKNIPEKGDKKRHHYKHRKTQNSGNIRELQQMEGHNNSVKAGYNTQNEGVTNYSDKNIIDSDHKKHRHHHKNHRPQNPVNGLVTQQKGDEGVSNNGDEGNYSNGDRDVTTMKRHHHHKHRKSQNPDDGLVPQQRGGEGVYNNHHEGSYNSRTEGSYNSGYGDVIENNDKKLHNHHKHRRLQNSDNRGKPQKTKKEVGNEEADKVVIDKYQRNHKHNRPRISNNKAVSQQMNDSVDYDKLVEVAIEKDVNKNHHNKPQNAENSEIHQQEYKVADNKDFVEKATQPISNIVVENTTVRDEVHHNDEIQYRYPYMHFTANEFKKFLDKTQDDDYEKCVCLYDLF